MLLVSEWAVPHRSNACTTGRVEDGETSFVLWAQALSLTITTLEKLARKKLLLAVPVVAVLLLLFLLIVDMVVMVLCCLL